MVRGVVMSQVMSDADYRRASESRHRTIRSVITHFYGPFVLVLGVRGNIRKVFVYVQQ